MLNVSSAIWWGYASVAVMHQLSLCISCRYASVVVMHQLSDYVSVASDYVTRPRITGQITSQKLKSINPNKSERICQCAAVATLQRPFVAPEF